MPSTTISARPDALLRYADLLESANERLAFEGRRLSDAIGRLAATCTEYSLGDPGLLVDRIFSTSRREAELAGWVRGVALNFSAADSGGIGSPNIPCAPIVSRNPLNAAADAARWIFDAGFAWAHGATSEAAAHGQEAFHVVTTTIQQISWNWAALRLDLALHITNDATTLSDGNLIGTFAGALLTLPLSAGASSDMAYLILAGDSWRWFSANPDSPVDMLALLEQGFWNMAFGNASSVLLLSLATQIEELNRQTTVARGASANSRPQLLPGELPSLSVTGVFTTAVLGPDGLYRLPPGAALAGAISYYQGEQVSMFRIGEHSYLFAICGLDPANMANSPNGFVAVIRTATGTDHSENAYYREVRERFLAYLTAIPPGSELNFTGHSMGGGMIFLLLNDPAVQSVLMAGGYTIGGIATFGAVRPTDPTRDGIPPSEPSADAAALFADTSVVHYVDREDRLANSVGAGYGEGSYADVQMLDNAQLDLAATAHTSYETAEYASLPTELQTLPFTIDPLYFELYRSPEELPEITPMQAPAPIDAPPADIIFA